MMERPPPLGTLLATVLASIPLAACILPVPAPANYYEKGSRENVSAEAQEKIQPCVSTKEDVLLELGEPDIASEDERRLGYGWTKATVFLIGASPLSGEIGSTTITGTRILEVSFDESNLVTKVRVVKKWESD